MTRKENINPFLAYYSISFNNVLHFKRKHEKQHFKKEKKKSFTNAKFYKFAVNVGIKNITKEIDR